MLTIELVNETPDKRVADYRYRVLVNGREIAQGRVLSHDRTTRWQGLVFDLAKQAERDRVLGVYEMLVGTEQGGVRSQADKPNNKLRRT